LFFEKEKTIIYCHLFFYGLERKLWHKLAEKVLCMNMNKIRKKVQLGFTMIEMMFVLGVSLYMGLLYIQSQTSERNITQARNVGKQMQSIATAMNMYITNRYGVITTLTNAPGTAADPGPRTCTAATSTCSITIATLIADGLLPTGFAAIQPFTTGGYVLALRRTGVGPYNVDGMAITSAGWVNGASVKYDLAGEALKTIGPDGAMTFQSSTTLSGYQGSWTETNANYPSINSLGQIAVRSGAGASAFSQFLRRDGTLPMTGALNMGNQDITSANDISTSTGGCKRTELSPTGQIYSRDTNCISRFQNDPVTGNMTINNSIGTQTYNIDSATGNDTSAGSVTTYSAATHTTNSAGQMNIAANGNQPLYLQPWATNGDVIVGGGGGAGNIRVTGDIYLKGSNTPLSIMLPEYSLKGVQVVADGAFIASPNCGATGGVGKVVITPSIVTARIYQGGGWFYGENGFLARATVVAGGWVAQIRGWPAGNGTNYGLAHVYCDFRNAG
jgi:type II secretory pathway pseudopilin PulG